MPLITPIRGMKSQRNSQSNSTVTRRQKNIANKRASPLWLNISNTPPFLFLEIRKKKHTKKEEEDIPFSTSLKNWNGGL